MVGESHARMMGLTGAPDQDGKKLVPKERHGVKTMSIGYLLAEDKPVVSVPVIVLAPVTFRLPLFVYVVETVLPSSSTRDVALSEPVPPSTPLFVKRRTPIRSLRPPLSHRGVDQADRPV